MADQQVPPLSHASLSQAELSQAIEAGELDTVLVVFTDMQGRLQGKRVHARFFLDEVLRHGMEGCNYLMAVDVDMNTVAGYSNSSWEQGYGDFMIEPDLATLRLLPWLPGSAMVQCDLLQHGGQALPISPRQILRSQLAGAAELGFSVMAATELEFLLFEDSFADAWDAGYQDLRASTRYNVDYSILGTTADEPVIRDIRNGMYGAGLVVESSKGECNLGQHEIAFKYDDALRTADNHVVFKTGAKEIAAGFGRSLTFMAKYDQREGNSCHIHMSLRGLDGSTVFAGGDDAAGGRSETFSSFVAGVQATLREFTLLYAPNVNSYKRYQKGSFAPTAVAWGEDNRTCALRVVGQGAGLRVENRVPGGDVNPYLALAAMLAAGLQGIREGLSLGPALTGNAYERTDVERVPTNLRDARDLFLGSAVARAAFGDETVEHYAHGATVELEAYDSYITDWELRRGFERL